MAHLSDNTLERIARYEEQGRIAIGNRMRIDQRAGEALATKLDSVIEQYEARLKTHKDDLDKLQIESVSLSTITSPSPNPRHRLKQLRTLKLAYDDVTNSRPNLPDSESGLAVLRAVMQVNETMTASQLGLESALDKLYWAEKQVKAEERQLSDLNSLSDALQTRLNKLTSFKHEHSSIPPSEASGRLLDTRIKHKKQYEDEAEHLSNALFGYIRNRLGAMIAAEEIGGPVVGDLKDVTDDMLAAGFSMHGKSKRASANPISDSKRQQRIDEVWGSAATDGRPASEDEAAIAEMTGLVEQLLAIADENAGSYVDLKRDSAAARYLVRAKVAQFHPKDARKLRLVDLGLELGD